MDRFVIWDKYNSCIYSCGLFDCYDECLIICDDYNHNLESHNPETNEWSVVDRFVPAKISIEII